LDTNGARMIVEMIVVAESRAEARFDGSTGRFALRGVALAQRLVLENIGGARGGRRRIAQMGQRG